MIRAVILVGILAAGAHADPAATPHRWVSIDTEVFASGVVTRAEGDTLSAFEVGRAEVGAAVGLHPNVTALVRLEAVRSATGGGTVGIDGNSLVIRVKRAAVTAHGEVGPVTLAADAGLVADPWIATLEADYPLRALAATASERELGWDTSDLGVCVRAELGRVHAAIAVGNGEGRRFPERNDGKTTTGVIGVRVVDTTVAGFGVRVDVDAVGRDGSVGPASTRERRFGGGVRLRSGDATAGAEVVRALGVADRGELEATVLGAWAAVPVWRGLGVAARWNALRLDGGLTSHEVIGAVSYDVVPATAHGAVRAFAAVAWDRDRTTAPGADADATRFLLVIAATGSVAVGGP